MMAVSEDIWDQLEWLDQFKNGNFVKEKVKNSLRSFTYNFIDLDLSQFNVDRRRIHILRNMSVNFAILKPDKGNGIVILKRSDYINSLTSLFDNPNKFKKVLSDPTYTRLTSLQAYLSTLLKRGEISVSYYYYYYLQYFITVQFHCYKKGKEKKRVIFQTAVLIYKI